jgi:hypothetical protein
MKFIAGLATILGSLCLWISDCSAQDFALDRYTCAQFLTDIKDLSNGEKLLKSMMMISWATGYAAAFQPSSPRADTPAIRLIAATLGSDCQKTPDRRVVEAIADQIKQLATGIGQQSDSGLTITPVPISDGDFKAYNNFDLAQGDSRRLQNVELSQCKATCKSDRQCKAFSYDKWNKWCFLKSTVTTLTLDPSSISGVREASNDPEQTKAPIRMEVLGPPKVLRGSVYGTASFAAASECQKACEQDRKCLGFAFTPSDQHCRLFDSIQTIEREDGVASGYKNQLAGR